MTMTLPRRVRALHGFAALIACTLPFATLADATFEIPIAAPSRAEVTIDEDGDTYLAQFDGVTVRITRVARDGAVRYRSTVPMNFPQGYAPAVNGDRLCLPVSEASPEFPLPGIPPLLDHAAACFDRDNGSLIYLRPLGESNGFHDFRVGDDGSFVLIGRVPNTDAVTWLAPDGAVRGSMPLDRAVFVQDVRGRDTRVFQLDPIGSPAPRLYREHLADGTTGVALDSRPSAYNSPMVLASGEIATIHAEDDAARSLRVHAADGSVARELPLPAGTGTVLLRGHRDGTDVFTATMADFTRVSLAVSGTTVSVTPLAAAPEFVDAEGRWSVSTAPGTEDPWLLQTQSLVTGAITRRVHRDEPLPYAPAVRVLTDGSLVYAQPRGVWMSSATLRITVFDGFATPLPPIAIAQPGLRGAWASRDATGQGLLIDVDPASRTVFAPWFTFSNVRREAPLSTTRWYTLQGAAAADANSVDLGIYVNEGGNLANPPATTARRVGSAKLAFAGCDALLLDYAFDAGENDALVGLLTLERLTPRNDDCVRRDGTVVAATVPPPVGAFDAKLSGTWLDPANGGQGLELIVRPGEALFGAWFTFDPAGVVEDPTRQNWWTLQAALPAGTGASLVVPIYSTTGGSFATRGTVGTLVLGTVRLTPLACDRIRLEYQLSGAGGYLYVDRDGAIELRRFGGCAP